MSDIINSLIKVARHLDEEGHILSWYIFGSYLRIEKHAKDLDVLILYRHVQSPSIVRESLNNISLCYPLDLIFMTDDEERGFDFINQQQAKKLYPIS